MEDHPRSRGVYASLDAGDPLAVGSSPLARGLRRVAEHSRNPVGIIPARAGFTPGSRSPRTTLWDHPRSRGVYPNAEFVTAGDGGSSPLARGLRARRRISPGTSRIIPARAGFTGSLRRSWLESRDHPRSRGVYSDGVVATVLGPGSSPLARGLLTFTAKLKPNHRIVPARAGFTTLHDDPPLTYQDHPRSRGVYAKTFRAISHESGSSPLARGLRR